MLFQHVNTTVTNHLKKLQNNVVYITLHFGFTDIQMQRFHWTSKNFKHNIVWIFTMYFVQWALSIFSLSDVYSLSSPKYI